MRADCLGIAGHPDVKTPYLDSIASDGVRFENAYTAVPSCIAARCGLMTGLSQKHHGRVGYQDCVEWNYDTTIAGELTKSGYYTQCVGKMHVYPIRESLGFHNIELHDGYLHWARRSDVPLHQSQIFADDYLYWLKSELGVNRDVTDTGIDCNSFITRPWQYEEKYHPTNYVTDRALDFMRRRDRRKPFFLMVSYVRPHPPFDMPECFFDMYKDRELTPPYIGDWADSERLERNGRNYMSDTGPADKALVNRARAGYYGCISHVDNQIGRLLDGLHDHTCGETIIIFTSDHGELLGDHYTLKKTRPYQGSVNIPLIIRGAGMRGGKIDDRLTELRDIMPTLIDIAGGDVPNDIDGFSLLGDSRREYLHGEHSGGDIGNQFIVTENDKYCWFTQSGREQYFDLKNDPHELHDAINDSCYAERITQLRNILIRELEGREEGYSDGEKLIAGRPQRGVLNNIFK